MPAGLEAAITGKQETEAKFVQAQLRITQLEEAVRTAGGIVPPPPIHEVKPPKSSQTGGPVPPPPPGPSGPPPPPPPSNVPPPPGGLQPPAASSVSAADAVLAKLGMKRKKKWSVEGQMKKTNWKAIPLNKLTGLLLVKQ